MNDAEIQIQFPKPGTWQEFTLTAIYPDKEGYTRTARYAPNEIPADQAPAMAAVVAALPPPPQALRISVAANRIAAIFFIFLHSSLFFSVFFRFLFPFSFLFLFIFCIVKRKHLLKGFQVR